MQIYVCIKHVPDSAANISIIDQIRIDDNLAFLLNPYDEHAVTEAVRVRDLIPESEVIAVCLGPDDAEKTVRSALAMGADRGILITCAGELDSIEIANGLHSVIGRDSSPGMIFTGKESIDTEGMQTMFRLGALFDFPVATNVSGVTVSGDRAVVDCDGGNGALISYEMDLPCILGAGRGLNTPRYPTFPDVVKSKKKKIEKIAFSDLNIQASNVTMKYIKLESLTQNRHPRELTGDTGEIAQKIVTILKQEARVIS
jgi:electron transfer flavoprotein beta subunit